MPERFQELSQRELQKNFTVLHLLQPHWKALLAGLLAVGAETVADLLEPWPLKVVLDSVLHTKKSPDWLSQFVNSTFGQNSLAVLKFTALAVIAIAVVGAIGRYI